MNPLPLLSAWLIALVCGLVPVILAAVVNSPQLHMVAAGGVALVFALIALREANALRTAPSPGSAIASSTARFSGLVWAWGALGIFITYVFILPGRWHEWWHFVLGFGLAAFLSIAFSILLDRDRAAGRTDPALLKIGRALAALQLAGVTIGIISMFADGKFPRAASYSDWAACNIFFFGALAIAAISIHALRTAGSN